MKGFTLVELLAVLVIISILALITVVSVGSILSSSKDNLESSQKTNIENAARVYYLKEGTDDITCVDLETLISKGYIESSEVINPKTREAMTGSVLINYSNNQYSYEYQDNTCE